MSLNFEYSYFWLIIILLASLFLSYFFYRKDKSLEEVNTKTLFLLRTLRFLSLFLLATLLLKPLINKISKTIQKPEIVILQDNSKSLILTKDSAYYKGKYKAKLKQLVDDLNKSAKTNFYTFDNLLHKNGEINFSGEKTDIYNAVNNIENLYAGRKLAAIILATDGIVTQGGAIENIKSKVPVYSILMGDSTQYEDLSVSDVLYNKDVFLGNIFPVVVDIKNNRLSKSVSSELKIYVNGKLYNTQKVDIDKNTTLTKVPLKIKADKKGVLNVKLKLSELKNEQNKQNNTYNFAVNVVDSRKKILIISNSPHPDVAALKSVFKNSSFIKIESTTINNAEKIDLDKVDLLIFHQLPSKTYNITDLLSKTGKIHIPVLFIFGSQTDFDKLNKLNIPFKTEGNSNSFEYTQAAVNKDFNLFTFNPDLNEKLSNFSPLYSTFKQIVSKNKINVFLYQKIKNIETSRPLLAFIQNNDNIRYGFLSGEGLWRWKLFDYMQNKDFNTFNNIFEKTVQYLTADTKKKHLNINYNNTYLSNENVIIKAYFYNNAMELNNSQELNMQLVNDSNQTFNYTFDKTSDKYFIDLGKLPSGNYKFVCMLKYNNKTFKQAGSFYIVKEIAEAVDLTAKYKSLSKLSENTKAKYYSAKEFDNLPKDLKQSNLLKSVVYYEDKLSVLNDSFWYFILIVALLTIEWFIRKYKGSY